MIFKFNYRSLVKPLFDPIKLKSKKKNFLFFKISVLIFVWINFLNSFLLDIKKIYVGFKKKSFFKISYSKAPMAHKTNSQEKYLIKYFFFSISILFNQKKMVFCLFSLYFTLFSKLKLNFHPCQLVNKKYLITTSLTNFLTYKKSIPIWWNW